MNSFTEFNINPEISTEYDDTITVYNKNYKPTEIDFSIFGIDYSMDRQEVQSLIEYLQDRVSHD